MKKKLFKTSLLVALALIFSVVIGLIIIKSTQSEPEIDFFDIGQGDSSLIKLPNNRLVLIDGGPDNLVLKRLGENLPFYSRKIETIILSHFHDDHIIGLIEVIRRYQVATLIYMKGSKSSELLELLLKTAKQKNIKIIALENEAQLDYAPNCFLKLFNPLILKVPVDDNNSLVAKLNCGKLSALFSGDNSLKVETALLKTKEDWSSHVFKVSHHGSKTANGEAFLKAIRPNLAVISVGANNRFGHPNQEIIERAQSLKIQVKRTDNDGTVIVYN
jgi:competence protein ComEC